MTAKESAKTKELSSHLIDKYRQSVEKRYAYEGLEERFVLSSQLDEKVIATLRAYFLECLYPPPDERRKIDEAFDSLNSFISQPAKTWKLLGNMTMAVFRFGTHFPQALKAGVISLESYLSAKKFEEDLVKAAQRMEYTIPLSDEQFENCIAHIPRKDVESFTTDVVSLFNSMANTTLLKKTIAIIQDVISKMKKDPELYTEDDLKGVELGLHILEEGYALFKDYPDSLKKEIITLVAENEKWYQDKVFKTA